jgi:RNA-binding protein NOB1
MESQKPVHTVVLDTGSIIKNEPSVSTLLSQSECLMTSPAILPEIKDVTTRSRVESTLKPFLSTRSPNSSSIKFVVDFARRTGDLAVLSKPDIQIIALAYELECERNGGDWRLRKTPGQKRVNGAPPVKGQEETTTSAEQSKSCDSPSLSHTNPEEAVPQKDPPALNQENLSADTTSCIEASAVSNHHGDPVEDITQAISESNLNNEEHELSVEPAPKVDSAHHSAESQEDSDSDGWITPSNLKQKQALDTSSSSVPVLEPTTMQVAVLTTDFAMQNVILQMNLNLLSPAMTRVKHLKTFVLRCHACFQVTKDLNKQFCPRCGQPSLTRVSCSTNANGDFKLHLKKNFQWNHRGDKYSIPKPVHGSSNGRVKGGGKGGWGNELILAEDQKEYQRATQDEKKMKEKNLMDEDYLPSILTGDRGRHGGRVKIGAGKNVNSKKR